jgi:hypothetical protein
MERAKILSRALELKLKARRDVWGETQNKMV